MITDVKVGENKWLTVERDNGLPTYISLNSPAGDGTLERWDNNYVYVRTGTWRLIYDETGQEVKSEVVYS